MGKRITQLDAAAPVTGTEQIAIVQETRTKRMYLSDLRTYTDTSCQCTLVSRYNSVGTDADTKIKYLQTYQMPPDTLSTNGSWLEIYAWGALANSGNFKTLYITFGGHTFATPLFNGGNIWELNTKIVRVSQNSQRAFHKYDISGTASGNEVPTTLTSDLATQIPISVAGKNNTASADDIVCHVFIIRMNKMDADS